MSVKLIVYVAIIAVFLTESIRGWHFPNAQIDKSDCRCSCPELSMRSYSPASVSNRGMVGTIAKLHSVALIAFALGNSFVPLSYAADSPKPVLVYRSGKNPNANQKKDSKEGTKKDIGFLRCMSQCKSDCQLPGEGLAKTDCVQDCQDQCCNSYEQCSFKIKINSGNSI